MTRKLRTSNVDTKEWIGPLYHPYAPDLLKNLQRISARNGVALRTIGESVSDFAGMEPFSADSTRAFWTLRFNAGGGTVCVLVPKEDEANSIAVYAKGIAVPRIRDVERNILEQLAAVCRQPVTAISTASTNSSALGVSVL